MCEPGSRLILKLRAALFPDKLHCLCIKVCADPAPSRDVKNLDEEQPAPVRYGKPQNASVINGIVQIKAFLLRKILAFCKAGKRFPML